ncbi:MAG: hypothetical protein Q9195_007904 [Heterodermia aff. obscurata]
MPRWQKRFTCFYCGCRSANTLPADTRRWDCKKCEAVNHLDQASTCPNPIDEILQLTWTSQHGEITHPPATVSQPETRFAKARSRSESPPGLAVREQSPFCQRCIQNQTIAKDIIAEYTPSSTADWETSYKEFVKGVHETYPQVCEGCESQIREKMEHSDYFVSADNLGRSLRRSNESWISRRGWQYDLASLMLLLGKSMWLTSWIVQSLWHGMYVVKPMRYPQCVSEFAAAPSLSGCATQIFTPNALEEFCDELLGSLIGWALVLGLLSIWWNPMWVRKMKVTYGRLAGRKEYYQLQVMFLSLRWAGFNFITQPGEFELDRQQWIALHAFMLVLTLLSAILPYRTIRWDSTPLVKRTYSPGSLLAQEPRKPRTTSRPDQPSFVSQAQQNFGSSRSTQRFPINKLAPPPPPHQPSTPQYYHPPTPPPDEDAMDWEETHPPQNAFAPRPSTSYREKANPPPPAFTQKSPFYGHLPPNPVSPAHALRNPPYRPPPMERASAQQHNFFSRNNLRSTKFGADVGDEDASPVSNKDGFSDDLSPVKFGVQKFFPGSVYGQVTGIEDLFAKATTLEKRTGPSSNNTPANKGVAQVSPGNGSSSSEKRNSRSTIYSVLLGLVVAVIGVGYYAVQKGFVWNT